MGKNITTRNYNMSDGTLKQEADQLALRVTRDIAAFNTRGVTVVTVTGLEWLTTTFDAVPTDPELEGLMIVGTEAKDALVEQVKAAIRNIRNMANLKYSGTGYYNSFGFDDMNRLSNNDLYRMARRVVRVGTTLLAAMATEGLTAAVLTALDNLATALDTAINTQHIAIEARDMSTQDRITKGNTLYAEMVRLCSIGKALFADTDEAKYNDYVLIETSGTSTPTPPTPPDPS